MPSSAAPSTNNRTAKLLRVAIAALISLAGAYILTARINPAHMDYIEYWSSGHLLLHRANPYSPAGVLALEKAHGFQSSYPLILANPPWALPLITPLGFFSPRTGLLFWTLLTAGCILASVRLLIPNAKDTALALLFAPAIACIGSGQSSPFLLLGFALFLRFQRTRPFLAGAALLLMAIKPHLFLVFWVVLLLDCFYRRKFIILVGGAAAVIAATSIAMLFDPRIWPHYLAMLHVSVYHSAFLPTLSMLLRILIDVRQFWLLFIPSAIGVVWGVWYYLRRRDRWDWKTHGMILMLVTVLVSPYGFFTDEIVLLPAILYALALPEKPRSAPWILLAINVTAAVLYVVGAPLTSPFFLWTPTTWLAWFLYATGNFHAQERVLNPVKGEFVR